MNENQPEENLRILLVLLEKAEQILSIINLSDPIIRKYNQLKEMTYDKLGLDFRPLVKKSFEGGIANNRERADGNLNSLWELLNKTRSLNYRKSLIIELLFDMIEKLKFENNTMMKQMMGEIENSFQFNIEKIYNLNSNLEFSRNVEDLEFDLKMEEIKLKDFLGKSEISYKKLLSNIKYSKNSNEKSIYGNSSNFHTNEEMISNNTEGMVKEYERKIEDLRRSHERDIKEYKERFNELRTKYNPELENEFYKLKGELNDLQFLNDKINEMITPVHEKYYQKNASWYETEKVDFKFRELEYINFIISLVNKFFTDNKYLIDLVSSLQKEKVSFIEERNLPFVLNSIQNNNLLCDISDDAKNLELQSEDFHRNFDQVMDFINKNLEII